MSNINKLTNCILSNKIVAFPTDTIFGIACLANNHNSVSKIFDIKKRSKNKPLSIFAPNIQYVFDNIYYDEGFAKKNLITKSLEDSCTVIIKCRKDFANKISPLSYNIDNMSIGIRVPNDELCQKIANIINQPISVTSLNISNMDNIASSNDIPHFLYNQIDYVYEGRCKTGIASQIIDYSKGNMPILIRSI
jgi:tRNA threonylcarbamoyl adenosine modification protein (Sua5/YciO/YrdC/YwlC family)